MNKLWHTRQKGLTLLELLVTIAILAVIAAIAIPIVSNMLPDVKQRTVDEAQETVNEFVSKWNSTGAYTYDPTSQTWTGYVDMNGDGSASSDEAVEQIDLNENQYTVDQSPISAPTNEAGVDYSFTPNDVFTIIGANPTITAAGPQYDPITFTYLNTSFTAGSNAQQLSPTLTGGANDKTYSLSGTLPDGVTFDAATGVFTGPADSAWNFSATAVSTGYLNTCAITTSGGVKCWGVMQYGGLGDGTTNSSTPIDVVGLSSGVTAIDAGHNFVCVIQNGAAKCWGQNNDGELGDGTKTLSTTPVQVSGLTSGVTSISAGEGSNKWACAVHNGATKCWGTNLRGIGQATEGYACVDSNGNVQSYPQEYCSFFGGPGAQWTYVVLPVSESTTPILVDGLGSGMSSVTVGDSHACALSTSGSAKCWGGNPNGELGDGSRVYSATPVQVSGITTGATFISAGFNNTCAVHNGAAKCWGLGNDGRLGIGDPTTSPDAIQESGLTVVPTPVQVSGLTSGIQSVEAGNSFARCAVTVGGQLWCWGPNTLGDGTSNGSTTPVLIDTGGSATAATVGPNHRCVLMSTGEIKCWGDNYWEPLGIPSDEVASSLTPIPVPAFALPAGFPATVDVTVSDSSGSQTTTITLSVN